MKTCSQSSSLPATYNKMMLFVIIIPLALFLSSLTVINTTDKTPTDLFQDKATIKYARNFNIQYHKTYKVVNILNFKGNRADTIQYLLVERGTKVPAGYPEAEKIMIPVKSVIALSSLHIALLDYTACLDKLVGLGSFNYVNSPIVRQMIKAHRLKEVGTDGGMNNETIVSIHPDMIMVDANPDSKFSKFQTLKDAGIPVMINAEWLENSPLARTEWVKLMAAFVDKEGLVNKKFEQLDHHYHELLRLSARTTSRPTAMIGMPYKGVWFVPAGKSYMAAFLSDAGMNYKWAQTKGTGSLSYNFESVAPIALTTQLWLNIGYVNSKNEILDSDSRYADFKAMKTGNLFNNNKKVNDIGSNDYWESGAVNPDIVLQDLIKIAHPDLLPNYQLVYYKKLQ